MFGATPQSPRFSGLLMAGGESRRMGQDKALLKFEGEPLWCRQMKVMRAAGCDEVMIARGAQPRFVEGMRHVDDAVAGCGPLGGLVGALRLVESPWLVVLAVDLPQMTAVFLRKLMGQAIRERRGVGPVVEGRYEPLAAVYSPECRPLAEAALEARELSLQRWVRRCIEAGLVAEWEVGAEQRHLFKNVNAPGDLSGTSAP